MKKALTLFCCMSLLLGCNSAKRTQKFLAQGNYEQAINLAVKKLQKDKDSRKSDELIVLLEDAFKKVVDDDKRRITALKADASTDGLRQVYQIYNRMQYRQDIIRPLLPLYSDILGRDAKFTMESQTQSILDSRSLLVDALYQDGMQLMGQDQLMAYREAYDLFDEVIELDRNYKDVQQQLNDAHYYGTDFVHVTLRNQSDQIIPARLQEELLDFNTYDLDDFWTEFHSERVQGTPYNYGIALNFRDILISPERISEREVIRRKRIKDGWEYELDANGNVAKDSLGNDIKVDKYINVRATLFITEQAKEVRVGGNVIYRDLVRQRDMNRHPLGTEFIFQNVFAEYRGDRRALTEEDLTLLDSEYIPFPSNAQMVLDAGDDIKARLREILKDNRLR